MLQTGEPRSLVREKLTNRGLCFVSSFQMLVVVMVVVVVLIIVMIINSDNNKILH